MGPATAFLFCPATWGGAKRSNIIKYLISITKAISKVFKPSFVCLLTNEKYIAYQMRYSFGQLGLAPGVGLGDTLGGWGVQNYFLQKFNQILFVNGTCNGTIFWSPPPGALGGGGGVAKGHISLNFNLKVNFKHF